MPDQKLTIIIPEDETVEETVEVVQAWLGRGMTSGYYPDWTLTDVTEQPAAEEIAKRAHAENDPGYPLPSVTLDIAAAAVRIARGEGRS